MTINTLYLPTLRAVVITLRSVTILINVSYLLERLLRQGYSIKNSHFKFLKFYNMYNSLVSIYGQSI